MAPAEHDHEVTLAVINATLQDLRNIVDELREDVKAFMAEHRVDHQDHEKRLLGLEFKMSTVLWVGGCVSAIVVALVVAAFKGWLGL